MFHTVPFLIGNLHMAMTLAYVVVVIELLAIAWIRRHFMKSPLGPTLIQVVVGGALVFAVGMLLGTAGG
jgi:hypothetical protein